MKLHVFGDSHAEYLFKRVVEADVHWLGPWTMHRVARDGAYFVHDMLRDYKSGDGIVLVFGEIDIRCHLGRVADRDARPLDVLVAELAIAYVEAAAALLHSFPAAKIIVVEPVPPITPTSINPDFPIYGSEADRIEIHKRLAAILKVLCTSHNLIYFAIPRRYFTRRGSLKLRLSDGTAHVAQDEADMFCRSLSHHLNTRLTFEGGRFLPSSLRSFARLFASLTRQSEQLWKLGCADLTYVPRRFW